MFQNFNKEQKIALSVLGVFTVLVFVFWSISFKNALNKPFERKITKTQESEYFTPPSLSWETTSDSILENIQEESSVKQNSKIDSMSDEVLKLKDSDRDGLNDYDEIYIYHTSAYLEDTDSDGYNDKQEIDTSNDPNCPAKQKCSGGSGLYSANGADQLNLAAGQIASQINLNANSLNASSTEKVLAGNLNATSLRAILIQSGMDEATLNKISDVDLMNAYQDAVSQTATSTVQ